jgi:peptidoglycan/LPS O-acetylase OafA/YrhL
VSPARIKPEAIRFSRVGLDYFSAGIQTSPIQHFWSLSIEEQFYFVWPTIFMLLLLFKLSHRLKLIAVSLLIIYSLLLSMYQSINGDSANFFATTSRIWELGAGVLLAMSSQKLVIPNFLCYGLLISLFFAAIVIPQTMQWPTLITIPIVLATLILLSRSPLSNRVAILDNPVTTYIGDLSYLIYLWHWPVLILVKAYFVVFGPIEILWVISLTGILSVVTHYLVEKPIRGSIRLAQSPAITVICGSIAIIVLALSFFSAYQG